ncbi:MAG TPA: TlpA disulfide reductase family protein [Polyangiaceae bacterium]|nr:TlpA disulfide reductase family protein [Polyangiaceae bacterium]
MTINSWATRATIRTTLAFAALASGCAGRGEAPGVKSPVGLSTPASQPPADFAFDSIDERPVSAEATRGKPTVLAFFTTSSLPAQAQVDFLVAMARHDGDRVNYAVVALEASDARELVELYKKALSIPFPVALADAQTLAGGGAFGDVRAVPVTVMLDRAGHVVWRVEGRVAKSDELRAALRGL